MAEEKTIYRLILELSISCSNTHEIYDECISTDLPKLEKKELEWKKELLEYYGIKVDETDNIDAELAEYEEDNSDRSFEYAGRDLYHLPRIYIEEIEEEID